MNRLGQLLRDKAEVIAGRWVSDVLATYAGDASAAFARERDPFANPVGHALRQGTRGIVAALADDDGGLDMIRGHLSDMVRIRAIQEFSPSQALAFVFRLKDVVWMELGGVVNDPTLGEQFRELDRRIDRVALAAFDSYVACREQLFDLRVNEVKRSVAWAVERLNRREQAAVSGRPTDDGHGGQGDSR